MRYHHCGAYWRAWEGWQPILERLHADAGAYFAAILQAIAELEAHENTCAECR